MKKLTAGIFTVMLGLVSAGAADAAVASKGYVDQETGKVATSVTTLTQTVTANKTATDKAIADAKTATDEAIAAAKEELEGKITIAGGDTTALSNKVDGLETKVNTLDGTVETEGSVKYQINAAQTALNTEIAKKANADDVYTKGAADAAFDKAGAAAAAQTAAIEAAATSAAELYAVKATETTANTNKAAIGTLTELGTTDKTSLVKAINEVNTKVGTANVGQEVVTIKESVETVTTEVNTIKESVGTLADLDTTEKGDLVGAINEVKGIADAKLSADDVNFLAKAKNLPQACSEPTNYCVLTYNGSDSYVWEVIQRDGKGE